MNSHLPAPESAPPAPRRNWTRRLVNLLVALVVAAVAAATFVFSYSGVHAVALLGGVSTQLARYYPGLFDAVLVIACVAAVVLREARWWARLWAWLVLVLLLAAIGITDVLHAANYSLRPRPTEAIVAAAPVAAVLLAFSLLLTMLRQSRSHPHQDGTPEPGFRRAGEQPAPATLEIPSLTAEAATVEIPALAASPQLRPPAPPIALPAAFTPPPPVAEAAVPMPAPESVPLAPEGQPAAETGATPADTAPDSSADIARTREEPVVAEALAAEPPTVVPPSVPGAAHPEAGSDEASQAAATAPSESAEPPTVSVPVSARAKSGIRYAGGASPRTGRPETDDPGSEAEAAQAPAAATAAPTAPAVGAAAGAPAPGGAGADDYWDAEEAGPYAGLVYPDRDAHGDADDTGRADGDGHGGDTHGAGDSAGDQPPARRQPAELDDDAPPFATAPFAPVPRLNRVRSMPAPPSDDEE